MLNVGLTGNIGSGKSTVARLLAALGARVIDADVLARQATDDPAVLALIGQRFGQQLVAGGQLDRAGLAAVVFSHEAKRQELNSIIHPWVRQEAARLAGQYREQGAQVVVQDIPLLYEGNLQGGFDYVIVVTAPFAARFDRVATRSGLDEAQFARRDSAQMPLEQKAAQADFVIDNSAEPAALGEQVKKIWRELLALPPD